MPRHVSLHSWLLTWGLRARVWGFPGPKPSWMLCSGWGKGPQPFSICSPQLVMETSKSLNPKQPPGTWWGKKEIPKHKLWFTQHINVIHNVSCKQMQKKKKNLQLEAYTEHTLTVGPREHGSTKIKLRSGCGSISAHCGFCGGFCAAHTQFLTRSRALLLNQRSNTVLLLHECVNVLLYCRGGRFFRWKLTTLKPFQLFLVAQFTLA